MVNSFDQKHKVKKVNIFLFQYDALS